MCTHFTARVVTVTSYPWNSSYLPNASQWPMEEMLWEMNDLESCVGRGERSGQGALEPAHGLKAIPYFAFTKASLSCLQSWWKKQGPFDSHRPWIVLLCRCRAWSLGARLLRAPQLLGAALGTRLQLHWASVGQEAVQIFWIKFGSWIMQHMHT